MKQLPFRALPVSVLIAAIAVSACGGDDGDDGARGPAGEDATNNTLSLNQLGRYESGVFDEGAAEIVAFDAGTSRAFVVNANAASVDVLDLSDPAAPARLGAIDASTLGAGANSVDVADGLVAVAVEAEGGTDNGLVAFYNAGDLALVGTVEVGVLPDMVTFTHDGSRVLVANEGEPSGDYSVDPEGSVSLIDLAGGVGGATTTAIGFGDFNAGGPRAAELDPDVRVFGGATPFAVTAATAGPPATVTIDGAVSASWAGGWVVIDDGTGEDNVGYQIASVDEASATLTLTTAFDGDTDLAGTDPADWTLYHRDGSSTVAQDLEPEYIAVSRDDTTAWVTLQENNAVAVIDLANARVAAIAPLGTKDHNQPGNELDASNEDGGVNIRNWPVNGFYMPDSIAAFDFNGETYLVTANEGDAREYDALLEESSVEDLTLDPTAFPDAATLQAEANLGAKNVTNVNGDTDGDGDYDVLYSYGTRSFSVWRGDGTLVWDSGSDFERLTATRFGERFNNDNAESDPDGRSDNKGPEPEAITVGRVEGRTYAFIGLERMGGIMVYDVTNPESPAFVQYTNNRDFAVDIEGDIAEGPRPAGAAGDLGPEGFRFIPADDSPIGEPLLLVGNEVSGTTTVYGVTVVESRD